MANPRERALTAYEVADYLHIPYAKVIALLNSGEMEGTQIGRTWRVHPSEPDLYLKRNRKVPA